MTSHLHPVFQQALAPFLAATPRFPKTYCSQCGGEFGPGDSGYSHCRDHRPGPDYQAGPDLNDMVFYEYVTSLGLSLRCYFEHEPAERETRWEPGCSEKLELVYAFAGLIDISEVLSDDAKATIEEEALADMKAKDADDHTEAAIARRMA